MLKIFRNFERRENLLLVFRKRKETLRIYDTEDGNIFFELQKMKETNYLLKQYFNYFSIL